jgi:hypothetical protein
LVPVITIFWFLSEVIFVTLIMCGVEEQLAGLAAGENEKEILANEVTRSRARNVTTMGLLLKML